jgi:ppGpp synthetase/RelA/SpoT-type nucleotidyltranferase/tetratricopeptide (TPR) repeat protein
MFISYNDILLHVQSNESHYNTILDYIECIMRTAQDMKKVPIYSTKRRVKSIDSVYLKTKRDKVNCLDEIKDYAGYRILSLFEQDILDIHRCIIDDLKKSGFDLIEFRTFNWRKDDPLIISMKEIITSACDGANISHKEKEYKSIHYLFKYDSYYVEIQLRTLLQDVWAELEHAIAYKQLNVHPHIKKSFSLLCRDLQNNDDLVSHLKSISDREQVGHLYSMEKGGPVAFYEYESELIPEVFTSDPAIKESFDNYISFFIKLNLRDNKHRCSEAKTLFNNFANLVNDKFTEPDTKLKYILNMEEAFLFYWEGGAENIGKALKIYENIKKPFAENYMLHFRMGEIFVIKGEVEKALVSFDRCEELIAKGLTIAPRNHYRVKMKLAYINWLLGKEYIEFALNKIDEAEEIYHVIAASFPNLRYDTLLSNSCYYYLESYLISKEIYLQTTEGKNKKEMDEKYKKALEKLEKLEKIFDIEKARANVLDTIAWFYYNIYINDKKHNRDKLTTAKKYCELIGDRGDSSTFRMTALNIQKNHIQEIMSEK